MINPKFGSWVGSFLTQKRTGAEKYSGACAVELVGTDPVCDGGNLQWVGGGFGRYGYFGEEDALVGVGGC